MNDLSLIPIDDLMQELSKRFDHSIFMGLKFKGGSATYWRWFGNDHICGGLCTALGVEIVTRYKEKEKPITGSDL